MKILMLSDTYHPLLGGIEMHVASLARQLSEREHQVTVCTIRQRNSLKYEEQAGVKIHRLGGFFQKIPYLFKDRARKWHPPAQDWLISRRLSEIIQDESPDIIHTHGWILYSLPLSRKGTEIPVVHTLHDYRLFCPKILLMKKTALCADVLTKGCIVCMRHPYGLLRALSAFYGVRTNRNKIKSVDKFIAPSSFVKEAHVKYLGISDQQIVVIPNFYEPVTDGETKGVAELPNEFILFVGWLMPHKGIDVLIKAYQKLNTRTKLLIIGVEHSDYHYESIGNILVLDNAPHEVVMQAMSKCRFVVYPSICPDSCPLVTFEAMSQSKAIIASDIGGFRDIVVDDKTGILVSPNNVDELAEAIAHLLQRPALTFAMGNRGYERYIEFYTADVIIPRIISVYESLV